MTSDDNDSDFEENCTPEELIQIAKEATEDLLPEKSKKKYLETYNIFLDWKEKKKTKSFSENVLISYFTHLKTEKKYKPPTLWSIYSMLNRTIKNNEDVDISKYTKLMAFLKKENVGYKPKKSNVLSQQDIQRFISEASDDTYLLEKVILILGISGALRREEIHKIKLNDVEIKTDPLMVINIPETKVNKSKSFVISNDFFSIVDKYIKLRPANANVDNLLLKYLKGKCHRLPVGINTIGAVPKNIATYLKLPEPERYTSHCFRRSAATLLVSSGADWATVKRFGAWKSDACAEGYIEENLENKKRISNRIAEELSKYAKKPKQSTSSATIAATESSELEERYDMDIPALPDDHPEHIDPPIPNFSQTSNTAVAIRHTINQNVKSTEWREFAVATTSSTSINQAQNDNNIITKDLNLPVAYPSTITENPIYNFSNMNNCQISFNIVPKK